MKPIDFSDFNTGTLFLVRTPEVFPVGYAEAAFADMKENLYFDFAALLETWNCYDGVLWKSDKFPRSRFWAGEERDPVEECFLAADRAGMAFLPEGGVMHDAFVAAHPEGMNTTFAGETSRYSRIGLTPSCPDTLTYLIEKYETLLEKVGHHPSCRGICLPCENDVRVTYDRYTREAYLREFGTELPRPEEIRSSKTLENRVYRFLEGQFLKMYRGIAQHLKAKFHLPLMHYPCDMISADSFFQPSWPSPARNISVMAQAKELDMLNMQLHPPLFPNPYFFKMETENLLANTDGMPCMADTHFYHEGAAGRLPDMTPKRFVDHILSTVTPYGLSFFCYGFMAEELPLWKKELNPNAPVYRAYQEPHTQAARREMCVKSMGFVEQLRPMLAKTTHTADCAIYYPESLADDYKYSSFATEHLFGLHEMLNATALPTCMVAKIPASPEVHKALFLDSVHEIPAEELKNLKSYLAAGGFVFAIGRNCPEIEEVLGLQEEECRAKFVLPPEGHTAYADCYFHLPLDGRHFTELAGVPLLRYDTGEPAVTRKGRVIFFGASAEIDRFSQYRDFRVVEFFREFLLAEGLATGVRFDNVYVGAPNGHQFTSCDIFANEDKRLLWIRNFGIEQNRSSVRWEVPAGMRVVKALADGKEFTFENGETLPVFEHFVAVYAEKE